MKRDKIIEILEDYLKENDVIYSRDIPDIADDIVFLQGEGVTDDELDEFIYDIKHMQGLYQNQRYTQAEEWKNKLTERLDDIMREQIKKEKGKTL